MYRLWVGRRMRKNFGDFGARKKSPMCSNCRQRQSSPAIGVLASDALSTGLPPSRRIIIHGFNTSDGQKISKSLGKVVNPYEIVEKYGTDALRFFLAHDISPFEDSDFSEEKFKESYNANLANGIGNRRPRNEIGRG